MLCRRPTWMVLLSGKMKSLPQTPGYVPWPNSAPDSEAPTQLSLPSGVALFVAVAPALVVAALVEVVRVVPAPGTH